MAQYILDVPDEVVASGIFEDAAAGIGWKATILDDEGNSIANPVDPVTACLRGFVIPTIKDRAISARIERQMSSIREQSETEVTQAVNLWIQSTEQEQA